MGRYINFSTDQMKFDFVSRYGIKVFETPYIFTSKTDPAAWVRVDSRIPKYLPIVVLDNQSFKAFAIADSLPEFDRLVTRTDKRIESIWLVPKRVLKKI